MPMQILPKSGLVATQVQGGFECQRPPKLEQFGGPSGCVQATVANGGVARDVTCGCADVAEAKAPRRGDKQGTATLAG